MECNAFCIGSWGGVVLSTGTELSVSWHVLVACLGKLQQLSPLTCAPISWCQGLCGQGSSTVLADSSCLTLRQVVCGEVRMLHLWG